MNPDFNKCLENGKIIVFEQGKDMVRKEFSISESDLGDAKAGFQEKRYKWATIQGYYAMFHAVRALVYSKGYREKSHYCLSVALRTLFIEEGYLDSKSGRDFLNAMNLREAADYSAEFSAAGATAVIAAAEKLIVKSKVLLGVEP